MDICDPFMTCLLPRVRFVGLPSHCPGFATAGSRRRVDGGQVNEAVEHAAELAESNMKMLAHARGGAKMATQEWKRAQALLVNVAVRL